MDIFGTSAWNMDIFGISSSLNLKMSSSKGKASSYNTNHVEKCGLEELSPYSR